MREESEKRKQKEEVKEKEGGKCPSTESGEEETGKKEKIKKLKEIWKICQFFNFQKRNLIKRGNGKQRMKRKNNISV